VFDIIEAWSSPNIEGASLRDYVDYSRRIGGVSPVYIRLHFPSEIETLASWTVKNHLMSTRAFDAVDQDGASTTVGTLS
jgi:hypothetical protein